jgi:hypothetical protein
LLALPDRSKLSSGGQDRDPHEQKKIGNSYAESDSRLLYRHRQYDTDEKRQTYSGSNITRR